MYRVVGDQRILRGVSATLTWQGYDGDGTETDPGVVTVGVAGSDGTIILAAGTATSGTGTAPRTVTLPANKNQQLDLLTATWTTTGAAFTTYIEVCGAFYFSLTEARASDTSLADITKYPDADILTGRREVEDEFESICGVAFVPRFTLEQLDGRYQNYLELGWARPKTIRSISYWTAPNTFTAFTSDQLANLTVTASGRVSGRYGFSFVGGTNNVQVGFEHGFERCPPEIKRAALTRLRHRLNFNKTGIPDRATNFAVSEGGTFTLASAGATTTGLPEVDAVLKRPAYNFRVPAVA